MVEAIAAKNQVKPDGLVLQVSPSVLFVFKSSPYGVFNRENNMVGGEITGIMDLSLSGPSVLIDVTGTKWFFKAVIESHFSFPTTR